MTELRQNYAIHNTCRSPHKRDARRQLIGPDRSKLNLNVGHLIIHRGRPLLVGGDVLRSVLPQLVALEASGMVEVFDYKSIRVDLKGMLGATAPVVAPVVAPVEPPPPPPPPAVEDIPPPPPVPEIEVPNAPPEEIPAPAVDSPEEEVTLVEGPSRGDKQGKKRNR